MSDRPNCYECEHHSIIPGDAHIKCLVLVTTDLIVEGDARGKANGWFNWPGNFDPTWLLECNGFMAKD